MGHMTLPGQPVSRPREEKGRWRFLWPEITDPASARAAARHGAYAALFVSVVTALFATLALLDASPLDEEVFNEMAYIDAAVFLVIAVGIFMHSRLAALLGLAIYVAERIIMMAAIGPKGLLVTIVITLAFVTSVRGTRAVQRFQALEAARAGDLDRSAARSRTWSSLGRIFFWSGVVVILALAVYLYYGASIAEYIGSIVAPGGMPGGMAPASDVTVSS